MPPLESPPVPGARNSALALRASLVRFPGLPLALAAVGIFIWFASANGGYDLTTLYPGSLVILGLVLVALVAVPRSPVARPVAIAVAALAAYTAWSYLSITWAAQKGDAWDGANRTALYLLVFTLFAVWKPRARPAAVLLGIYVLGVATVGLVELLRASSATDPRPFFLEGRFASPAGYQNADVALWFSAFWPAVTLGARRETPVPLRALFVGAAVLLGGLTILGESRGWLFTVPFALLIFVAIVPARVRTVVTLLVAAVPVAIVTPTLLHVYDRRGLPGFAAAVSSAAGAVLGAAAVTAVVAAAGAALDRRARPSRDRDRQAGRALVAVAGAAALVGLVLLAANGSRVSHAISKDWREFKTQHYASGGGSRFSQSLGSDRYDFWRVALNRFGHAPLQGLGADNFQEAYLARRHGIQEPKYPHSVELRTLSQTGLVGTALLGTALVAALVAGAGAIRRRSGLGAAVAAGATASFAYWLVHGSVDWFWELPALGAPAFALLGLAAGLVPSRPLSRGPTVARRPLVPGAAAAAVIAAALVPAASFAAPWIAELEANSAIASYNATGRPHYGRLDTAASLNPLSAQPKLIAGSIAQRLGQDERAIRYFREALDRDPGDIYSHLELGTLLAQGGRRAEATALLRRAVALDPRDEVLTTVLRRVRRGRPVNITAVNQQLAERSALQGR